MATLIQTRLTYETAESAYEPGEYVVEAIGPDGEVYVAVFAGPDAKERANDYAEWKNRS